MHFTVTFEIADIDKLPAALAAVVATKVNIVNVTYDYEAQQPKVTRNEMLSSVEQQVLQMFNETGQATKKQILAKIPQDKAVARALTKLINMKRIERVRHGFYMLVT